MTDQIFNMGDHVRISSDLPSYEDSRKAGCEAIVQYSREDKYGESFVKGHRYNLFIKDQGSSAWTDEKDLTLIDHNRVDLYIEWKNYLKGFSLQCDAEGKTFHLIPK